MRVLSRLALGIATAFLSSLFAQTIEFEANGLRYQALTRAGLTVMFAPLPVGVRDYTVIQVAATNGSPSARSIKPEDFTFHREDGVIIPATPARRVVEQFLNRAGRNDVIRLVKTYEVALYGLPRFSSTNGYEARREAAHAEVDSARLKAAAAASAIVLVQTRLAPSESTDGALFFPTQGKPLGAGKLVVLAGVERFEFEVGGDQHPAELIRRP